MLVKSVQRGTKPLMPTILAVGALLIGLTAPLSLGSALSPATVAPNAALPLVVPDLGRLPLAFEPNAGQTDSQVRFMAHAPGGVMYFTPSEVVLSLVPAAAQTLDGRKGDLPDSAAAAPPSVVRMQFVGSNTTPVMASDTLLPGKVNYLIGEDPSKWNAGLPTYANITYSGLYPGIDLAYNGTGGQLKGTYTVAPGGDPNLIRWRYYGAEAVSVDGAGNLVVVAGAANGGQAVTVTEQAPIAWQTINGKQVPVSASYALQPGNTIGFLMGSYDPSQPLTIDPTLLYSTYLGGSNNDYGEAIAADNSGNVWTTGRTTSADFPHITTAYQTTLGGGFDAFVAKTNTNLTGQSAFIYATYLGGNGEDQGRGIAIDGSGNAYVTGLTLSTDFPVLNPYQGNQGDVDAFLTKLNAGGTGLLYSTYLGGSDRDVANAIAVNGTQAFITGDTYSDNYPLWNNLLSYNALQDVFVTRINTAASGNNSLVYSELLTGAGYDYGLGIAADANNFAYITGMTSSDEDFPITDDALMPKHSRGPICGCDAFFTKLNTAASGEAAFLHSTYLGSVNDDFGNAIAVDAGGNAYLVGEVTGPNWLSHRAYQSWGGNGDAWLTRISTTPTGDASLVYSTHFGGVWNDVAHGVATDGAGNAYLVGHTNSRPDMTPPFPIRDPYDATCGGCASLDDTRGDAFVAKINTNGSGNSSLIYSTYLGGGLDDSAKGIDVDTAGNAYVTGATQSVDFPVVNGYQSDRLFVDSFIAKLGVAVPPSPTRTATRTATRTNTPVAPSPTRTVTRTATRTPIPATPTRTATRTNTPVPPSPTRTATRTATRTNTPIPPTATRTSTPRPTQTPGGATATRVPSSTPVPPSPTRTRTPIPPSPTRTATRTNTAIPLSATRTSTPRPTQTPGGSTATAEPTATNTPISATDTPIVEPTIETPMPTETPGIQPCDLQFSDVQEGSTFYSFVRCLACRGILGGYSDSTFRPGNNVTRGQLSKIVSNAAGFDNKPGAQMFEDVPPTNGFFLWVQRLASRGFISGYPCGGADEPCGADSKPYFRPNNNATRGQISKIVSNAAGFEDRASGQLFEDISPTNGFYAWVQRLASRGYIGGYPCGGAGEPCGVDSKPYFRPNNNATRGQVSKIVANTFFPNCETPAGMDAPGSVDLAGEQPAQEDQPLPADTQSEDQPVPEDSPTEDRPHPQK
jgi:hypothetical protein